jgi:hypothetical protein
MEIVEGSHDALQVTTFVQDLVQFRRQRKMNETRAAAHWIDDPSSAFEFFTVDPHALRLRIRQQLDLDVVKRLGLGASSGFLMHADECSLLEDGVAWSVVKDQALAQGRGVKKLSGTGDDAITLAEFIALVEPAALTDRGVSTERCREGGEITVLTKFSNLLSPTRDENDSSWLNRIIDRLRPSSLQYFVCVQHVTSLSAPMARFTAPAEWSRKVYSNHSSESVDYRLLRSVSGIRINFQTTVYVGVVTVTSILKFVASTLSLLGVPWTVTELVLSMWPRKGTPRWWRDFLLVGRL